MSYAIRFGLLAVGGAAVAARVGGWAWLLLWPAASAAVVAAGYAWLGPMIFGKRADGRLPAWSMVLTWPYLLVAWLLWRVIRRAMPEAAHCQVAERLWLGRRVYARELPPGIDLVVDLTAEFCEPASVRAGRRYISVPTLDTAAPAEEPFRAAVEAIVEALRAGEGVFVHCAAGHGRAATVVAAVLIERGLAADVTEAEASLVAVRKWVRLYPAQRGLVERVCGGSGQVAVAGAAT